MKYRILIFEMSNEHQVAGIGQIELTKEPNENIIDLNKVAGKIYDKIMEHESKKEQSA